MNKRALHIVDRGPTPSIEESTKGGGDPPYNGGMDARLTALETRWDAVLPTLATKSDIAELRLATKADMAGLRADMHENNASITKWTLATVIGLFFGFTGLYFAQANLYSKHSLAQPATQPAPIIIQVPAYPAPDKK